MEKKRILLVLILAAIIAGGAFAQMSVGGGIVYSGDWTSKLSYSPMSGYSMELKYPWNAFGFYGFFDAKYVEASAGLHFGSVKAEYSISYPGYSFSDTYGEMEMTVLSLGLLGKYPFAIGDKIALFPAVGLEYYLGLSAKDKDSGESMDDPGDFSHLWFRFGGGIDFDLTEKLYLRGTVLFGIRTKMAYEDDIKDLSGGLGDLATGFGPAIKLAIGYKF